VITDGFIQPSQVVSDGAHVWVTDTLNETLTELNTSTGAVIRVVNLNTPNAQGLVFDRVHLWVTDVDANSVTQVDASDGSVDQVLSAPRYGFNGPGNVIFGGGHVWVVNDQFIGGSVTELNPDGSLVRVLSGPSYRFSGPDALAFAHARLWVTNSDSNSVTVVQVHSAAG
jgi:sugar lactone lactonase YvrE